MIEVEIRGRLTRESAQKLRDFLRAHGEHVESHTREMIRLYDYPGFSEDPNEREMDIRLRDTDGRCEIMVKKKMSDNNASRRELSLKLADNSMETAKEVMKALGYSRGLWMHRKKEVFRYDGIEWSVVEAPDGIFYYEAEQEALDNDDLGKLEAHLETAAKKLDLPVFNPDQYRDFTRSELERVNKRIEW